MWLTCYLGIPLKDENNHEPTVQARQHHSSGGNNGLSMVASTGSRHHGNYKMSPLEIGMYVLLAAFCFAIVVFVVSCVVYASKFKPQVPGNIIVYYMVYYIFCYLHFVNIFLYFQLFDIK